MTDKDKIEATTTDENQDATAPEKQTTQLPDVQPDGESGQSGMFTDAQQVHINKIVGERVIKATRVATEKILTRLGTDSVDDAASVMEAHKKAQEEAMTEAEKLQADMKKQKDELNAKIQSKDEAFNSLQSKHVALLTTNAVLLEAAKKEHGLSPDIHGTLLQLVDTSLMNIGDDGVVTGAKEAIEKAIKDHPVLKANGSRGSGVGSPVSGTATPALTPQPEKDGKTTKYRFKL